MCLRLCIKYIEEKCLRRSTLEITVTCHREVWTTSIDWAQLCTLLSKDGESLRNVVFK
jgi:hypothetical protein